ncbi:MAG: hypothetical protein ACLUVB_10320, partial [Acutalibacteraceae bacterium]
MQLSVSCASPLSIRSARGAPQYTDFIIKNFPGNRKGSGEKVLLQQAAEDRAPLFVGFARFADQRAVEA